MADDLGPLLAALHAGDRARADAADRADNVGALLDAGADPNARQHGDFAPLMQSEQSGNLDLAELLIRRGAFVGKGA